MKKICLSILFLFIFTHSFFVRQLLAQSVDSKLESFAGQAMNKIINSDFDDVFNCFYIPRENTAKDTENDKKAIVSGLEELIQNQLGIPQNFSKVNLVMEEIITINMMTGSPVTTGQIPSTNLFYKANFSRFGDGYIAIGVHDGSEDLSIKDITIGLPVANPKSAEIAETFGMFMMNIAAEQQKTDNSR